MADVQPEKPEDAQEDESTHVPEHTSQLIISKLAELNMLANRMRDFFKEKGSIKALELAIKSLRSGLRLHPPGVDRSIFLNDLAGALWERYQRNGSLVDLNESIELLGEALPRCPPGHPRRAETLSNLSILLRDRATEHHSLSDLDQAIETQEAALALRPEGNPYRSSSLTNLSLCLRDRFKEQGSPEDLDNAIAHSRAALLLRPEGHHLRPSCLSNLAIALQYRYELCGVSEDLQESIELLRAALVWYPPLHSELAGAQFNLSISLSDRFRRDGNVSDLNEAIDLLRPLRERGSLSHVDRLSYINSLANCLTERFWHYGSLVDINEAISHYAFAVEGCPHSHMERSTFLNNLGTSLRTRFTIHGHLRDLEKAIENHQAALFLRPPGHLERFSSLNNLALCYKSRFERLDIFDDLTKAITLNQAALELCCEGDRMRSKSKSNLAKCLVIRFETRGTASDLTDAIKLLRDTLPLQQMGHPDRSQSLELLAVGLQKRFDHFRSIEDLNEAFLLYSELPASKVGFSQWDLHAASSWAESADKYNDSSAMTAYQTALTFLVRFAAIFPASVEHYQLVKRKVSSLAVDAFSYCIRRGDLKTAIGLLEQGRTVFWTHLARLGTPLDDLASSGRDAAHLAEEFKRVSSRLRTVFDQASEFQSSQTLKLVAELDDIISRIRTVPDFSRFLLPPEFPDLQSAAKEGPVIIMNASQYTCDAVIVLHDDDPVHVQLNTSKTVLSQLASSFRRVVKNPGDFSTNDIAKMLRRIWDLTVEPVVRALEQSGIQPLSRIWWCPTSDFTFLPLHAAAPFRKGQARLSELYISSYTPTLGALVRARKRMHSHLGNPPFAIVGTSESLACKTPLPSVAPEIALVNGFVHDYSRVTFLADDDATVERSTEAFKNCKWLHLACHGIPHKYNPFESYFALRDGPLTLKELLVSDFGNPDFAFLSACRTAVGDATTPDEVIHLAAAMQFGGFRSVIGTILPVEDAVAGQIVSAFYTHLLDGPSAHLDCTKAAVALHNALAELRGKLPFDQEIVFVHIGI